MMTRQHALAALITFVAAIGIDSFSPANIKGRHQQFSISSPITQNPLMHQTSLWMAEGEDEAASEDEAAAPEASADGESEAVAEEEAEPEEDPEVTALKKEIEELETTLKGKRSTLAYTKEQAEEFSKAGYARKVAEMENMRRRRSSMNSNSQSSATAGILTEFLPVYDQMTALKEKYPDSKYGGLSLDPTLDKMGVTSYDVAVGDRLDRIRMNPVESEHSADVEKDAVISVLSSGLELDGNIVRAAECVVSLGAEEEESAEEVDAEDGDDAKAESTE